MNTTIVISEVLSTSWKNVKSQIWILAGHRYVFDLVHDQFAYVSLVHIYWRHVDFFVDQYSYLFHICLGIYQEYVSDNGWR